MNKLFFLFFFAVAVKSYTQDISKFNLKKESVENPSKENDSIPTIKLFNKISKERDTLQIDTSLTIKKQYLHNYFQKDLFAKVLLSNEGQFYNNLIYNSENTSIFPEYGFLAKQQNYLKEEDIFYYSVATPFTEIQYRSVMQQGQVLNSTFAINLSENLNFAIGYRGLRSLGKYLNQLSSNGNFWFSSSFSSKNKLYNLQAHYSGQDLSNQENGGIINTEAFDNGDAAFNDRVRFEVYLPDANSFLKGHRVYFNHSFDVSKLTNLDNIAIFHVFRHEYKFHEYFQRTVATSIDNEDFLRFGNTFVDANIRDQSRYNNFHNQIGLHWKIKDLGAFSFFYENSQFNYFYNKVLFLNGFTIPNRLNEQINNLGAQYVFKKNKFIFEASAKRSITSQNLLDFKTALTYKIDSINYINASIESKSKLVDFQKRLFQSDYVNYNWFLNFNNEKINTLKINTINKWLNGEVQFNNLNDFTYFSNDAEISENSQLQQMIVSPKQYNKSITHFYLKVNKELTFNKISFDNSIIYQEVSQDDPILNLPKFVFRNATYYSNHFFKKALFLQTGFIVNYFSEYYANEHNPIIGDFTVQSQKKIGNYPVLDVFLNAKIQTFRVFIKYEYINSLFSNNTNYATPNQPFRDGMLRFGLTWDFFQ